MKSVAAYTVHGVLHAPHAKSVWWHGYSLKRVLALSYLVTESSFNCTFTQGRSLWPMNQSNPSSLIDPRMAQLHAWSPGYLRLEVMFVSGSKRVAI